MIYLSESYYNINIQQYIRNIVFKINKIMLMLSVPIPDTWIYNNLLTTINQFSHTSIGERKEGIYGTQNNITNIPIYILFCIHLNCLLIPQVLPNVHPLVKYIKILNGYFGTSSRPIQSYTIPTPAVHGLVTNL